MEHVLKRTALVPYSAEKMFDLVNDIESYPKFLPWCHSSRIVEKSGDSLVAELEIQWKGIHKTFSTRNTLTPHTRMEIDLVNGPLSHLDGVWIFDALDEDACKITLDMEFAFTGSFVDRLFAPIFQHIANTFVESFCNRAKDLYGKS